jgi:glyoxylase-like metal-dependent hydrolase (beta-lactamase superfamily II)
MRLIDNLYCYLWRGRGNNCHSYLFSDVLRGSRPHILIDPGHITNELGEHCSDWLISSMERDGIKPEDIGLIINTHCHPDHCEANQLIVDKTLAKEGKVKQALIAISEEEEEYRRTAGKMLNQMLGRDVEFEPNFYLKEGELNLGKENKLSLKIIHTPGHSPGSISIYWEKNKALISGDVLFYGGIGRTDFPGGDGKLLKQSIERLSKLDIEYLLPGHSTQLGDILKGKDKIAQNFAFIRLNYFPML